MVTATQLGERRTSVDEVFDVLHEEIGSLTLKPGDRISEADIAARFGVSRQPVRDAFNRLAHLDLLLIRPQRATEVRRFSMREIEKARFVRFSIETEILRRAATVCTSTGAAALKSELAKQDAMLAAKEHDKFNKLEACSGFG